MSKPTTTEGVLPELNTALSKSNDSMKKIQEYSNQLHPYRDGKSSKRMLKVVDWYIKEIHKGLKWRSLNLVRKIKIQNNLKYYWF